MSPIGIASSLFGLLQGASSPSAPSTSAANSSKSGSDDSDFSSALAVRMAEMQAQSMNVLIGSAFGSGQATSAADVLTGGSSGAAAVSGLSASGRNLSLFDPESGYRMMSVINKRDDEYKAQFAELSAMGTAVAGMQRAAQTLDDADVAQDNATIKGELEAFVASYNDWIKRFDGSVKTNGVLEGTQAAEVSLHELEVSVENIFNGAKDGFHGLADLGVTIDPVSNLASFDVTRLEQALASNRQGAVNTIDEFAANFAKSAELLNSANNFIPNRLANLDRVIDYIDTNKAGLQQEFGSGEVVKPSEQVAMALAAYQRIGKA